MKIIIALSLTILIILVSFNKCYHNDMSNIDSISETEEEKIAEMKKLELNKTLNIVSNQYNASIEFDTVNFNMTYQYQYLLQQNDRVIINRFEITNIEKVDSIYVVSIEKKSSRNMYIEFICTQTQIEKLCPNILNGNKITSRFSGKPLILKINKIEKLKFKIDSDGDDNGNSEPTTYIEIVNSDIFICKAEFIDIYIR